MGFVCVILDGLVQAVILNARVMERLLMDNANVTLMPVGVESYVTNLDVQALM